MAVIEAVITLYLNWRINAMLGFHHYKIWFMPTVYAHILKAVDYIIRRQE